MLFVGDVIVGRCFDSDEFVRDIFFGDVLTWNQSIVLGLKNNKMIPFFEPFH